MKTGNKLKGTWICEYYRNGKLIKKWKREVDIIDEGINRILTVELKKPKQQNGQHNASGGKANE
jgi:hypothetical protein